MISFLNKDKNNVLKYKLQFIEFVKNIEYYKINTEDLYHVRFFYHKVYFGNPDRAGINVFLSDGDIVPVWRDFEWIRQGSVQDRIKNIIDDISKRIVLEKQNEERKIKEKDEIREKLFLERWG